VVGRGHRAALLEQLVEQMRARADVWFASHGDVGAFLAA
jgi:hypothetical protein